MITMLLGGLWHGAGWTFVFWGALHGFYLVVNHAWHKLRRMMGHNLKNSTFLGRGVSWLITFLAVVASWVFFRAESFGGAMNILASMTGFNGASLQEGVNVVSSQSGFWSLPLSTQLENLLPNKLFTNNLYGVSLVVVLLAVTKISRNCVEIVLNTKPGLFTWSPRLRYATAIALLFVLCIFNIRSHSEFLYFQF
jgi:hypothetical protein